MAHKAPRAVKDTLAAAGPGRRDSRHRMSTDAPDAGRDATADAGSSRAGFCRYLISARQASGKTIQEIATVTRIPTRSLERLEAGAFEELPADVFVRGFLRSYARCVGLGEDEALERYSRCGMTPAPVASAMAGELAESLATLESTPAAGYRAVRAARSDSDTHESGREERTGHESPESAHAADAPGRTGPDRRANESATRAVEATPPAARKPEQSARTNAPRPEPRKRKRRNRKAHAPAQDARPTGHVGERPIERDDAIADVATTDPDPASSTSPGGPEQVAAPTAPAGSADRVRTARPVVRKRAARPVAAPTLVIDDDCPEQAETEREARAAREREDNSWKNFIPPSLLDSEEGSHRGALTLAVIILVIVATLTMSYLLRQPSHSGDGVTWLEPSVQPVARGQAADAVTRSPA